MKKLLNLSFTLSLTFSTLLYDNPCSPPCSYPKICHLGQCISLSNPQGEGGNCQTSYHCEPSESCISGVCIIINKDISCEKCKPEETCLYGSCVQESPKINLNENTCFPNCKSNQYCSYGLCVAQVQRCRGNSDCKMNQVCRERKCILQVEKTCHFACRNGYECKNGDCVPINAIGGCSYDTDCGQNEICFDSICIDHKQSSCSQACPTGFTCIDAQCIQNIFQDNNCNDNSDCKDFQHCQNGKCSTQGFNYVGSIKN